MIRASDETGVRNGDSFRYFLVFNLQHSPQTYCSIHVYLFVSIFVGFVSQSTEKLLGDKGRVYNWVLSINRKRYHQLCEKDFADS